MTAESTENSSTYVLRALSASVVRRAFVHGGIANEEPPENLRKLRKLSTIVQRGWRFEKQVPYSDLVFVDPYEPLVKSPPSHHFDVSRILETWKFVVL
jgi:hypothetical protein